jgi:hypothetical protein
VVVGRDAEDVHASLRAPPGAGVWGRRIIAPFARPRQPPAPALTKS